MICVTGEEYNILTYPGFEPLCRIPRNRQSIGRILSQSLFVEYTKSDFMVWDITGRIVFRKSQSNNFYVLAMGLSLTEDRLFVVFETEIVTRLYVYDLSTERVLKNSVIGNACCSCSISRGGTMVAVHSEDRIRIRNTETNAIIREISTFAPGESELWTCDLVFSPTSDRLFVSGICSDMSHLAMNISILDGTVQRRSYGRFLRVSPDGSLVIAHMDGRDVVLNTNNFEINPEYGERDNECEFDPNNELVEFNDSCIVLPDGVKEFPGIRIIGIGFSIPSPVILM
jgi:hypothetical protein